MKSRIEFNKIADQILKKRGDAADIASKLGITTQAVWNWRTRRIPAERVIEVEKITGVSRHILRPDIFPSPKKFREVQQLSKRCGVASA